MKIVNEFNKKKVKGFIDTRTLCVKLVMRTVAVVGRV